MLEIPGFSALFSTKENADATKKPHVSSMTKDSCITYVPQERFQGEGSRIAWRSEGNHGAFIHAYLERREKAGWGDIEGLAIQSHENRLTAKDDCIPSGQKEPSDAIDTTWLPEMTVSLANKKASHLV